ncbi:olfactory receptor 1468-like, partial [Bufo gargarizans]|uniref:olfactory receptor 1468-like n=1 Tax=Bufo gargarizans TaxID=30331 RepID=UPI001CF15D46
MAATPVLSQALEKALRPVLTELADIKTEISQVGHRVEALEQATQDLNSHANGVTECLSGHAEELNRAFSLLEDQENRSRRRNIRIKGLPESWAAESLRKVALEIFADILDSDSAASIIIERIHRALRPQPAADIGNITISDHAPCLASFTLTSLPKRDWCWKLNESLLYNQLHADQTNLTMVTEFFLLGFPGNQLLRSIIFLLFLLVFGATIYGNLLIIVLVSTSKNLYTPMYFFISQLSISDILLTTNIVPNLLHILLNNGETITFIGCITQFYFFSVSEVFECLLLTVMSYDRYVAICNPLRYTSIITSEFCVKSVVLSWVLCFFVSIIVTITPSKLSFCASNIIDHFFCDIVPLVEISCSDAFIVHLEMYLLSIALIIAPSTIIIKCYVCIIVDILRIPSSTGRQKAFSTCSSHLIVVSIFYWTLFSVYVFPTNGQSSTISKILSLLYTVFTPLVNPVIYSLRNKDIRKAIRVKVKQIKKSI